MGTAQQPLRGSAHGRTNLTAAGCIRAPRRVACLQGLYRSGALVAVVGLLAWVAMQPEELASFGEGQGKIIKDLYAGACVQTGRADGRAERAALGTHRPPPSTLRSTPQGHCSTCPTAR